MESGAPHYWFPKKYADFAQRLRVPCGFLLLVTFALLSHPTPLSLSIGLGVSIPGLVLRGWAAGHLAKNRDLAASGPYSFMRNPLYIGTLIAAAGIVIASLSLWLVFIFAAVFLLVYLPAIELEEQHLRVIFAKYSDYAAKVNRFLPFSRWPLGDGRFSWAFYRRNEEYKAAIGFVAAASLLAWKCGLL